MGTLRPQAPSTRARPTASAPRTRLFDMRMSLPSLGVRRVCRGRGGLFLVEVAVGFHRTGELEAGVGADRGGGVLVGVHRPQRDVVRSEEHTSELQSLMRISYAVFCLKNKTTILLHINKSPNYL